MEILLISTGGTIACKKDKYGNLKPALTGEEIAEMIPELKEICNLTVNTILDLDSTNIQPEEWIQIADAVNTNLALYDGFIITHGTDTMAYTAAALSYILQNVKKPVIITGSQHPVETPDSDGKKNILDAARTAVMTDYPGVYIVFDGDIIKGIAASKLDTVNLHAFRSITEPRAGCIDANGQVKYENPISTSGQPYKFCPKLNQNVLLLKLFPGFSPEILRALILSQEKPSYDAVILETFGAGGLPYHNRDLISIVKDLINANVRVYCKSQCLYGGSDLSRYEVGQKALDAGAEDLGNITSEAALAKVMWELGQA